MTRSARLALGAFLLVLLALPASALAAGISVTTTEDEIGGSGCSLREAIFAANDDSMGTGADCTQASGDDVITLGFGTYDLELPNVNPAGENLNATGDLDVTSNLTIQGQGINQTTIDANSIDRVLHMLGISTVVELRDLKVTGGAAPSGDDGGPGADTATNVPSVGGVGDAGAAGGGIIVQGGDLTLTSVEVSNNSAGSGGEGGIGGLAGDGTGGNPGASSTGGIGGTGGSGGGVSLAGGTQLHATDTVFDGNFAGDGADGGTGGTGGVGTGSNFGANGGDSIGGQGGFGGDGGAISADAAFVELERVTMTANQAGASGSGGNGGTGGAGGTNIGPAGGRGGTSTGGSAVFGGFGGAISQLNTTVTVTDSSLEGNKAGAADDGGLAGTPGVGGMGNSTSGPGGHRNGGAGGPGGAYGAISGTDGAVTLVGSTVSGNTAGAGGDGGNADAVGAGAISSGGAGGGGGFTGGVFEGSGGGLTITNSTISGNGAGLAGAGGSGSGAGSVGGQGGNGGGQAGVSAGAVVGGVLNHVTIAGNFTGGGAPGGAGATPGADGSEGTVGGFHSDGNNIVLRNSIIASNSANQCSGAGFVDGGNNISFPPDTPVNSCPASLHSNPLLDALAANGGATQTMALGVGSPAIDAVPASGAFCEAIDQRDIDRPRGPACDIGAFESARPLVTTGAFSAITQTSATVAGTVNPNARPTTYRFAFGKTTAYGSLTTTVAVAPGDSALSASAALTGLEPSTLYHYRVTATNGDGTVVGADKTFTTAATPKGTTPTTPPGTLSPFAGVSILTKSARADRKGRLSVKVRCPASAVTRCKGKLSLTAKIKRKTVRLGRASFSIAPGKTKTVRIKLSKSKRRLLARSKRLKGSLSAAATDGRGGKAKTTKRKLSVKAPKRKQ